MGLGIYYRKWTLHNFGKSWGSKGLERGVEESEEITNQPWLTGKSGAQACPAAGVGWGGGRELEMKSREDCWIFMTTALCVHSTASAGRPGGAAIGRTCRQEGELDAERGRVRAHRSLLACLGWLSLPLSIDDF